MTPLEKLSKRIFAGQQWLNVIDCNGMSPLEFKELIGEENSDGFLQDMAEIAWASALELHYEHTELLSLTDINAKILYGMIKEEFDVVWRNNRASSWNNFRPGTFEEWEKFNLEKLVPQITMPAPSKKKSL